MALFASRNGWLDWAIRVVAVLIIGALAYLAYSVFQGQRQADESSLAARAIANLEQAVRDDPENASVHVLLGDAYRDTGRPAAAVKEYDTALELSPDLPEALVGLAIVAMQTEEWRTSEGYWQRAIEVLSENQFAAQDLRLEKAYYYYGTVLIELAEYDKAVANLKEALRITRSDADTHYALSVAYRELGSLNKQRESLETALMFVPTLPEANYDLGLLLLEEGDEASAAEHFRRSADYAPERPEPIEELSKLGPFEERLDAASSLAEADADAAYDEVRIAVALDPTSVDAARLMARLVARIGDEAETKAAWERVLTLAPGDPEATAALAEFDDGS